MGDKTNIEWCDATFNPWIGCTKIGPGCDNCYAEALMDHRFQRVKWGPGNPRVRTSAAIWKAPIGWNIRADVFRECGYCGWRGDLATDRDDPMAFACQACGVTDWKPARRRVFCASLADVFDNEADPQWRAELFRLIRDTPNLDWLMLTKRIGNAGQMIKQALVDGHLLTSREPLWPWPNFWLGITVVNQEEAARDIPKLLATPARTRFLSIEPMLGAIDLTLDSIVCTDCPWCLDGSPDPDTGAVENCRRCEWTGKSDEWGIDWVVVGGESGPGARQMHPDWVRSIRDQCATAGVGFLFKQWGEWRPPIDDETYSTAMGRGQSVPAFIVSHDGTVHCFHNEDIDRGTPMLLVGKKHAGRLLDGVQHDGYPE